MSTRTIAIAALVIAVVVVILFVIGFRARERGSRTGGESTGRE